MTMQDQEAPAVENTTTDEPTKYQHMLHDCQYEYSLFGIPARALCGVETKPQPEGAAKRPKCPDCVALQGKFVTCPACGRAGVV